ncbi:MAG: glycosyltransferase family 4 protein [Anaerolineae bacterium]
MRIGLVIYGALDTLSGGYLYDRKLVAHLQAAGDSVEVFSIPWRNYARHLADNLDRDWYARLRRAEVDVLIQDELNHPSLWAINRRLRGQVRYPILSLVHHLRSDEVHAPALAPLYRLVERRYLDSVEGWILNSETTRRAVAHLLGRPDLSRCVVAYPAGDRFQPDLSVERIRERAGMPGPLRLIFVGNLIPRKGLHVLLDALTRLPSGSWQLTVVGGTHIDPRYTRSIHAQIAHRKLEVRLTGVLRDAELAQELAASHVMVVPSSYEGFGIVYLEGMSFGLPSIATTAGAAHEIIADGENGYLVPPDDPAALAARLDLLQRDRARLVLMSESARRRFLAAPRWEESMARIRTYLVEWTNPGDSSQGNKSEGYPKTLRV